MPVVQVSQNTQPYHVDDFGDECERSCKGALHFLPASTKVITKSELEHVQKAHKGFAKLLHVVPIDETKTRAAKAAASASKKAEPVAERASHRPSKAQRRAADTAKKVEKAKAPGEITRPSLEPMVAAAEERKLSTEDSKPKDKKKDKSK